MRLTLVSDNIKRGAFHSFVRSNPVVIVVDFYLKHIIAECVITKKRSTKLELKVGLKR